MSDDSQVKEIQRITAFHDFVLQEDNFAAVGFAVEDMMRDGWKFCRIAMNEHGQFVIWLARTWEAAVRTKEKSA